MFNHSGVIPPYVGDDPATAGFAGMSPFPISLDQFIVNFGTTSERRSILKGYLQYRADLRAVGIEGWQWLDGSFLEEVEKLRNAAPNDLDLVTVVSKLPQAIQSKEDLQALIDAHPTLFYPDQAKAKYLCDAYFVHLAFGPYHTVKQASYWLGLFSHQRLTSVWKGILEVQMPLSDNDSTALAALTSLG